MQAPPIPFTQSSPFNAPPSAEHLQQVAHAKQLGKKVRRAVVVASISAWTTAIFAGLTIITSVTSLAGLILGCGMAIVAIVEFKGVTELKCLDRTAPRRLAMNQLAFAGLLFSYASYCMWASLHRPSELTTDPQIEQMLGSIRNLEVMVYVAVYGFMMLFAILGPGINAFYYYTRTKHIDAYLKQAPAWIIQLQRAGMSV